MQWIQELDHTLLLGIIEHVRQDWLTPIMQFITSLGDAGAIWLVIAVILLMRPKTRRCGAAMLTALALGLLVGNLALKNLIARPRPFHTYLDILPLDHPGDLYSFPSGHTLASFCAAAACFGYYRKAGIACGVLAVLIGFSRLYVGVHYPTDVLCGALLGILLGFIAVWIVNQIADHMHFRRIRRG